MSLLVLVLSIASTSAVGYHSAVIERYGSYGVDNGEFSAPYGILFIDNKYYAAEFGNDRIQVLDTNWDYVNQFGGSGAGLGQLENPVSIYYNDTYLFIPECYNNRISVFDLAGNFVTSFGEAGSAMNQFSCPTSVQEDQGILYISDHNNDRISMWNESTLEVISTISSLSMASPYKVAISEDKIFVTEINNDYIVVFDKHNKFYKGTIGSYGVGFGQFTEPGGIEYINGHLLITDVAQDKIVIYNENGVLVKELFPDVNGPFMYDIDGNRMIIPEGFNHRITVMRMTANPYNVVARANEYSMQVSWEINPEEGIMDPESYLVYRDDGSEKVFMGEVLDTSFIDCSALPGVDYTYHVSAKSILSTSDQVASNEVARAEAEPATVTQFNTTTVTESGSFPVPHSVVPFVVALMLVPITRKIKNNKS